MDKKSISLGDVVKLSSVNLFPTKYYIVSDIFDDVSVEISKIMPSDDNMEVEVVNISELEVVVSVYSRDYEGIIKYLKRKGISLNYDVDSDDNDYIYVEMSDEYSSEEDDDIFNESYIDDIMDDKSSEKDIEIYKGKMDVHLSLLSVAIKENNSKGISFNKDKLDEIRKKLMELEYFSL